MILYFAKTSDENITTILTTLAVFGLGTYKLLPSFQDIYFNLAAIKSSIPAYKSIQSYLHEAKNLKEDNDQNFSYEFEPEEDEILEDLLPKNISTQVFKALLENAASEQGSRMTAMDNATRNAGDLVDKLTIDYNRSRQASITKELIEIISGAESL